MDNIRRHGRHLHKALPLHASVGNMIRRVLKIIREEYAAGQKVCNPYSNTTLFQILILS